MRDPHLNQQELPPPGAEARPARRRRRTLRRLAWGAAIGVAVGLAAGYVGIRARWWRPPDPPASKSLCAALGCLEEAYNAETVVPGRIYRSCRPDERWYRYVAERYGVRHVVRLIGEEKRVPLPPPDLKLKVTTLAWSSRDPPPRAELEKVLAIFDDPDPVLVHCWGGSDRTGYAVAAYRILRQGWSAEDACREMNRYWHDPKRNPKLQEDLRALERERSDR